MDRNPLNAAGDRPGSGARADGDVLPWPVSLLWPQPITARRTIGLSSAAVTDLALERIVQALDADRRHARAIRAILCELCADPETIAYRQEILADILADSPLADSLHALLPELAALANSGGSSWPGDSPLMPVIMRLRELDRYVACIDHLRAVLEKPENMRSRGLQALRAGIDALAADPDVVALRAELPALHELIGEAKSITIGLNLDADLEPEAATIVEINNFQYKGARSLLGRLLPGSNGSATSVGLLHHAGPKLLRRDSELYKDLQRLLEAVAAPLAKALARYRELHVGPLASLERELAFMTGAAALITRLQATGIAMCLPAIAAPGERACTIETSCNLGLALQMLDDGAASLDERLVRNDASFQEGRILVITGPNRGGKTTYCRALGQAQVLFQTGLSVPGVSARLSPVDGIWTHFPLPEVDRPGAGRLDEEVQRLRRIFEEATQDSLIMLNEPLTSTSERDALAIAIDFLRALQMLGARTVFVTHLHELAHSIPQLNAADPAWGRIRSLVAEAIDDGRGARGTFHIRPGAPVGRSYAAEIARQHGLTFAQLRELLVGRVEAEAQRSGDVPSSLSAGLGGADLAG